MALTLATFADKNPPWQLALLDANFAEVAAAINDGTLGTLYLVDTGSPNALQVQLPAGLTLTLAAGAALTVRAANTNTSATVTLDIQGVGTNTIVNPVDNPLGIGQIQQGGNYGLQFDGANWQLVSASGPGGTYEPAFQSGSVQINYQGGFGGFGDFQFGFALPNASGIPSSGILLGGAGKSQVVYVTDAQIPGLKGINVIREAGDAGDTTSGGGDLLDFAGGSINGAGGQAKYQGGTSVNGQAGPAILQGGNSTNGIPGDAFVEGGVTGSQGANVHLIPTTLNGTSGVIRHRWNSIPIWDEYVNGSWFFYNGGNGFGLAGQPLVSGGPGGAVGFQVGFTGPIVVGSATLNFNSGILTSVT